MQSFGSLNAPIKFFPVGKSIPVLEPTDESTIDKTVVGIWMKSIPRIKVAATKPAKSPTTPPPKAITVSFLW